MDERWVYGIVGLFVVFGLWMYTVNTVHIRRMALRKERLQTRVKMVCRLAARQLPPDVTPDSSKGPPAPSLVRVLQLVEQLSKGEEYLFVLDAQGRTWADGSQAGSQVRPLPVPSMSGDNTPLTKILAATAQGGGFVTYDWKHPKSGDIKPKLSYVAPVADTPFLVGCGTYA